MNNKNNICVNLMKGPCMQIIYYYFSLTVLCLLFAFASYVCIFWSINCMSSTVENIRFRWCDNLSVSDSVWIADCEAGSYGDDCKSTCGNCKISACDFETGLCDGGCSAGWKGARCKSGECLDLRIEYEVFPCKQSRIFYISFDDIIHSLTCLIYSGFSILCFPFCHGKKKYSAVDV